jgi:hypothetical protein
VKYCQSAKKLKYFFLQILVLITSISNFNYKNQEKIFLKKSLKHSSPIQSRTAGAELNLYGVILCCGFLDNVV